MRVAIASVTRRDHLGMLRWAILLLAVSLRVKPILWPVEAVAIGAGIDAGEPPDQVPVTRGE